MSARRNKTAPYRLACLVVGTAVTGAGLALLALPGPAVIVIPLGLAVFSEAWA